MPGSSDIAYFVNNCTNSANVNVTISISGINIATGYTGTISQTAGASVTVGGGHYTQADGTFSATENLILNGHFTKTSGTFEER